MHSALTGWTAAAVDVGSCRAADVTVAVGSAGSSVASTYDVFGSIFVITE